MAYQNKKSTIFHKASLLQTGYSLVELLVAIGIFGVLVTTLFTGFIATREGKPQQEQRMRAAGLYQETIEALRIIREEAWDNISTNGTYYPQKTATSWALVSGIETITQPNSQFTRSIVIADVNRDANGNVVSSGGTLDPSTKAVTITVTWDQPLVTTLSNTIYMTRYLDNLAFIHTTVDDFSQTGHLADTVVFTSDDDGEIKLDASGPGRGDWCTPSIVSELDLPRQGAARAITAIFGKVFTGTGENASGVSAANVSVTDTIPPISTVVGTFDGFKTNDVFGTNTYGFLATDTNSKEVEIITLSTMTEAGYFDIPGANNANSIFVKDGVGYVVSGGTLYTFDATTMLGSSSQPQFGSFGLAGNGVSIYVVNGVAYVAIDSTSTQLQLVDVSNPSSMSGLGTIQVNGAAGRDVYVSEDGSRAYLVTAGDASKPEFFIINTENKSSISSISSYDTNGMDPKGVDIVLSGNRAVIVGVGGEEYQVVTITPETSIVRCGGLNDDTGIYDISTVVEPDTDAYAYINTGQSSSEMKIIEGGPGGTFAMSGTYESAVFDTGSLTAFNRLSFTGDVPADTTLRFQIAGAPPVAGACDGGTYNFVGPDGTAGSYFTTSPSAIPFSGVVDSYNPTRCFKYKVYLDTNNILFSPSLLDITVNYSP